MSYPQYNGTRVEVIDSHTGGEPTRVVVSGGPGLGRGTWPRGGPSSATISTTSARPSATSRGAPTRWSAPCSASRSTRPARRGSSSSTMSACSGCAATARSAWSSPWPTSSGSGASTHKIDDARRDCRGHAARAQRCDHQERPQLPVRQGRRGRGRGSRRRSRFDFPRLAPTDRSGTGGDVAWGGNWFFLVIHPLPFNHHPFRDRLCQTCEGLTDFSIDGPRRARAARGSPLASKGAEIDHIEHVRLLEDRPQQEFRPLPWQGVRSLAMRHRQFAPPSWPAWSPTASSRKARSGSKKASSAASPEGFFTYEGNWTIPHIRGSAYVNAEATLILNEDDPS